MLAAGHGVIHGVVAFLTKRNFGNFLLHPVDFDDRPPLIW